MLPSSLVKLVDVTKTINNQQEKLQVIKKCISLMEKGILPSYFKPYPDIPIVKYDSTPNIVKQNNLELGSNFRYVMTKETKALLLDDCIKFRNPIVLK